MEKSSTEQWSINSRRKPSQTSQVPPTSQRGPCMQSTETRHEKSIKSLPRSQEHLHNLSWFERHMKPFQTLRSTSPVLLGTARCFQAPLEQCKVLADSARSFSGASESTCSCEGSFRMQWNVTYTIVTLLRSWHLYACQRESLWATETSV